MNMYIKEMEEVLDLEAQKMTNLEYFLNEKTAVHKNRKFERQNEIEDFIKKVGYIEGYKDNTGNDYFLTEQEQNKILTDIKKTIFYDTKARMFIRVDVEDNKNEIKYYSKLDLLKLIKQVYYPNSFVNIMLPNKRKKEDYFVCNIEKALIHIMDENTIENISFKFNFFGRNEAIKEKSNLIIYNNDILFFELEDLTEKNLEDAPEVLKEYLDFNPVFDTFNKLIVASMFTSNRKTSFFDLHFPANFGKSFMLSIYKELGVAGEVEFENLLVERSATSPEMIVGKMFIYEDEFKIFKSGMKKITNEVSISAKNRLKMEVPVFSKVMLHAETVNSFKGFVDKQIQERITSYSLEDTGRLNDLEMFKKIGSMSYKRILKHYALVSIKREIDMYKKLGEEKSELKAIEFLNSEFKKNNLGIDNDLMTNLKLFFKDRLQTIAIDILADDYYTKYSDFIYVKEMHNEDLEMFIVRPKELFLKLIKESEDNNFKKTSIYKADKFEELLGGKLKMHKHPYYKTTKRCIRLKLKEDLDLIV